MVSGDEYVKTVKKDSTYYSIRLPHKESRGSSNEKYMISYIDYSQEIKSVWIKKPIDVANYIEDKFMEVANSNVDFSKQLDFNIIYKVAECILGAGEAMQRLNPPTQLSIVELSDFYLEDNGYQLIFRPKLVNPVVDGTVSPVPYNNFVALARVLTNLVNLMEPCIDFDANKYEYTPEDLQLWETKIIEFKALLVSSKNIKETMKSLKMAQLLHLIILIMQENRLELTVDGIKSHAFFQEN